MYLKFYAVPCETSPGKWQVMAERDTLPPRLMDFGLAKPAALRAMRHMEQAAMLAGAIVVA